MQFFISSIPWNIDLVDGPIYVDGECKIGTSSLIEQHISISKIAKPELRIICCFHEIAHAVKDTFDIHEKNVLDIESACNLVGLLPVVIGMHGLCRIYCYVQTGIDSDNLTWGEGGRLVPI